MRRPAEVIGIALGLLISLFGIFKIEIPFTLNRLSIFESYVIKYIIIIIGLIILIFSITSAFSKKSYFQNKKVRNFLGNLALFCITLFICFIILEILLHLTAGPSYPGWGQRDQVVHHAMVPLLQSRSIGDEWDVNISINSLGLRDDELRNASSRILMLGDSFTFGSGVEANETFSSLLEQRFQDTEVINAGVVSYSPILEYLYLTNRGILLNPDIVILNFDMSDLIDDYRYEQAATFENGNIIAVSPGSEETNILIKLFQKIKTLNLLKMTLDRIYAGIPHKKQINTPEVYDIKLSRFAVTLGDIPEEKEHWERTLKYISLIKEFCDKNDITFVLATYPYGHQVSGKEWDLGRHLYGLENDKTYSNKPMVILETYAKENNITFINALPAFRASDTYPLFLRYDGHFTREGHILYSEVLYEGLYSIPSYEPLS